MKQKKMTGKPTGAATVSLDAFIAGADPVTEPQKSPSKTSKGERQTTAKRGVGKPPMTNDEVRKKTVQITLTEQEYAALKKRAGKVPISTFVRDEMKSKDML